MIGQTKRDKPLKEGPYIFEGTRWSPANKIITVKEIVEVVKATGYPEMMVRYLGSARYYPVSKHDGTWVYIGDLLNE